MEDRKREEVQEEQKEKPYVTRREFYICFLILLVVIFLQGMLTRERIQQETSQLRSGYTNQLDILGNRIGNIPTGIENALLEADNPLRKSNMEIVDVDMKGKTATLRLTAMPKEYQDSMGLTFFVSCDGAEAVEVSATAGKDRTFTAEVTVPFCGEAMVSANVKKGDTEYLEDMGGVSIEGEVLPSFTGNRSGGCSWNTNDSFMTLDGEIFVDISLPSWLGNEGTFDLKKEQVEVYIDGKKSKTVPAKEEIADPFYHSYVASFRETDAIRLERGKTIEFIFRAEDANGLRYRFVVERGFWNGEDGYVAEEPAESRYGSNPNLTIE